MTAGGRDVFREFREERRAKRRKKKDFGFRVQVCKLSASNGVTYVVCLFHPTRPVGQSLFESDGLIEAYHTPTLENANETGAEYAEFLGCKFEYLVDDGEIERGTGQPPLPGGPKAIL